MKVYFNNSCNICRAEINLYKKQNIKDIEWIDITDNKSAELETQKAKLILQRVEQQTILDAVSAYFDLIFKSENEIFNLSNISLFERQVESDNARIQKGEITLTDLAQSESSLAGANAN